MLAGILLIFLAAIMDLTGNRFISGFQYRYQVRHIQREIIEKESDVNVFFNHLKDQSFDYIYCNFNTYLEEAEKKGILLYIYDKGQLLLWSDNHVLPNQLNPVDNEPVLQRLANGYYLQINRRYSIYSIVALIPVESAYPTENAYLKNELLIWKKGSNFRIVKQNERNSETFDIKSKRGNILFSLSGHIEYPCKKAVLLLYTLGILLVFFFVFKLTSRLLFKKEKLRSVLLFSGTIIVIIIFWKVLKLPRLIYSEMLFSPEIYASSYIFSSLGDLLISVLIITYLIYYLTLIVNIRIASKKLYHIIYGIGGLSITILVTYFISRLVKGLVINSNISFDLTDLYKFNTYSFISFFILFFLFYGFIRLSHFIFAPVDRKLLKFYEWLIVLFIPGLVFFFILRHYPGKNMIGLYFAMLIWILYIFSDPMKEIRFNLNTVIIYILISAAFIANLIIDANYVKEIDNRKHLIATIASEKDPIAEELLNETVTKITQDNYVRSYFDNPLLSNILLNKRLKQLYFSGYFNQYEFNLYTFTSQGNQYKSHSIFDTINYFYDLIRNSQQVDSNGNIYFVNNYDGAPGYIIYIPVFKGDQVNGQMIMVLKQKPFSDESFYPDLLIEGNINNNNEILKNYSYAIYKNNYLTNQKGNFAYPLTYAFDESSGSPYYTLREKKYSHLIYKLNNQVLVIMSREITSIFTSLALFSMLFILATLLIAVFLYSRQISVNLKNSGSRFSFKLVKILNPFSNMSFKYKIHSASLMTILFAVVLTGFFTIRVLKNNSLQNARIKLEQEIKIITENLDNYFADNSIYDKEVFLKIKNTADQFKTDINLFDTDGNLIASSQMPLYERKIISNKMDALAYSKLKIDQSSQLIHNENIAGKVNYLSAYGMIRDISNNVVAFINIPYFSKEKEIEREISYLVVTTINLYVFLFLLITLISVFISNTITVPLENIRQNLGEVQLGRLNKKIDWKGTDEIGLLVEEYNKMLDKVEESAEALARSERESAWKEMARQVAHEIKNPLTPMKLNIQQLVRAWHDKAPNLEENFKKITEILINRIDTLSEIATEFSQFARMPEPNNEKMILEKVLTETVHLFSETENTEFILNTGTENTVILADEKQLSRAFNNLIKNAIQSIPGDRMGKIIIETEYAENRVIVIFSDNGCGIPEEIQDKIFLPNFSTKSSGMGLGLAIVSKIISLADGKIWYETRENEGSRFFVSFPVV